MYKYIYISICTSDFLKSCIASLAVANKTQVHGQRGMAHSAVWEAQLARMPFPCFVGREKSGGHLPSLVKKHTHPSMVYLTTWMIVFLNGIHVYKPIVPWKNRKKKRLKVGKDHLPKHPFCFGTSTASFREGKWNYPLFRGNQWMQMSSEFEGFPLQSGIVWVGVIFWDPWKWPLASLPQILEGELLEETWKNPISSCWNRSKRMKLIALGFWVSYKCAVLTFWVVSCFLPRCKKVFVFVCMYVSIMFSWLMCSYWRYWIVCRVIVKEQTGIQQPTGFTCKTICLFRTICFAPSRCVYWIVVANCSPLATQNVQILWALGDGLSQ